MSYFYNFRLERIKEVNIQMVKKSFGKTQKKNRKKNK